MYDILENKKRILFVYSSEADIYNELGNRYNDNYEELNKIKNYIENNYKYSNFTILAVHMNKTYQDTENIINYNINVPENCLSDDMSTHLDEVTFPYRNELKNLLKEIFQI